MEVSFFVVCFLFLFVFGKVRKDEIEKFLLQKAGIIKIMVKREVSNLTGQEKGWLRVKKMTPMPRTLRDGVSLGAENKNGIGGKSGFTEHSRNWPLK